MSHKIGHTSEVGEKIIYIMGIRDSIYKCVAIEPHIVGLALIVKI